MPETMTQTAPYPTALRELVEAVELQPGYEIWLEDDCDRGQGSRGMTLFIVQSGPDTYHPEVTRRVAHLFIVPAASYDIRSWRRWLLEQYRLVLSHEACEWFKIAGDRPYAPSHGPGNDPYLIRELGTEEDVRTSFRGVLNP